MRCNSLIIKSSLIGLPALCLLFTALSCQAAKKGLDALGLAESDKGLSRYKVDREMLVDGWRFAPDFYVGQARLSGSVGIGAVLDKGDFAFAINSERISIIRRF